MTQSVYGCVARSDYVDGLVLEQRVQVSPTRFRISDVCVVVGPELEQIYPPAVSLYRDPLA